MKILVAVKDVIDPNVNIRVKPDHSDIEKENVKTTINPFDEVAVEEAVRLREGGIADEVIVVSIGNSTCKATILRALSMGADRAILVESSQNLRPLSIAKKLATIVKNENIKLAFLGKLAIDDDCNQTGQMLAGLLNWPQATFASNIIVAANNVLVQRETDIGKETIKVGMPAVITADLRLNEPRFVKLVEVLKAKKKPLAIIANSPATSSKLSTISITPSQLRRAGIIVKNEQDLVNKLRQQAVIK